MRCPPPTGSASKPRAKKQWRRKKSPAKPGSALSKLGTHRYVVAVVGVTMFNTHEYALYVYTVPINTPYMSAIQGCARGGDSEHTKRKMVHGEEKTTRKLSLVYWAWRGAAAGRGVVKP